MKESNDSRATWAEDEDVESAVLRQLLDLHPTRVTIAELTREVGGAPAGFGVSDGVARAVRELVGVGLLHREEEFVAPTRAALRLNELLDR
jgi:hypothetical protein